MDRGVTSAMLPVLLVAQELLGADRSASYLKARCVVSQATLARYLKELRHMGCEIVSRREAGGYVYRLENAEAITPRLLRWIELERNQTLLDE